MCYFLRFAPFGLSQPSSHHGWLGWLAAHTRNMNFKTGYACRSSEGNRHKAQRAHKPSRPAPVPTSSCLSAQHLQANSRFENLCSAKETHFWTAKTLFLFFLISRPLQNRKRNFRKKIYWFEFKWWASLGESSLINSESLTWLVFFWICWLGGRVFIWIRWLGFKWWATWIWRESDLWRVKSHRSKCQRFFYTVYFH